MFLNGDAKIHRGPEEVKLLTSLKKHLSLIRYWEYTMKATLSKFIQIPAYMALSQSWYKYTYNEDVEKSTRTTVVPYQISKRIFYFRTETSCHCNDYSQILTLHSWKTFYCCEGSSFAVLFHESWEPFRKWPFDFKKMYLKKKKCVRFCSNS